MIEYRANIHREDLRLEPNKIFLFGDNLTGQGFGGQAREMRGEPNAIGIPTKKRPSNTEDSFFTDREYYSNVEAIKKAFDSIPKGRDIVIPKALLGTGLARLPERAPKTYAYLLHQLELLKSPKEEK